MIAVERLHRAPTSAVLLLVFVVVLTLGIMRMGLGLGARRHAPRQPAPTDGGTG